MSHTRDYIKQITEARQRQRFGVTTSALGDRLSKIERAFSKHNPDDSELTRYFPVALVACIEGFFRLAIKDLIDAGEPFVTNAEKSGLSPKLDFAIVRAIHGKTVTIGEIVAHGLKMSRLEHVDSWPTREKLLDLIVISGRLLRACTDLF